MPDMVSFLSVLAITAVGLLCGLVGLALGSFSAQDRVAWSLGVAAIVVSVLAPVLGLVLLWGQLQSWCYLVPAAPIIPGVLTVISARLTRPARGFPVVLQRGPTAA
jgi:quinol-cytochrome oxidoreductase complex cytochrome b subunit